MTSSVLQNPNQEYLTLNALLNMLLTYKMMDDWKSDDRPLAIKMGDALLTIKKVEEDGEYICFIPHEISRSKDDNNEDQLELFCFSHDLIQI